MHKKSFTFGLGVGILLVTGIFYLLVSLMDTGPVTEQLSNDQLRERVESQGYVIVPVDEWLQLEAPLSEPEPPVSIEVEQPAIPDEEAVDESEEPADETEEVIEDEEVVAIPTTGQTAAQTATLPTQVASTPAPQPVSTVPAPAEPSSEPAPSPASLIDTVTIAPSPHFVTVNIPPFMIASDIAQLLHERGVIDSADSFTQFLISEGYTTRLWAGESTFHTNMSYAAALHALTTAEDDVDSE